MKELENLNLDEKTKNNIIDLIASAKTKVSYDKVQKGHYSYEFVHYVFDIAVDFHLYHKGGYYWWQYQTGVCYGDKLRIIKESDDYYEIEKAIVKCLTKPYENCLVDELVILISDIILEKNGIQEKFNDYVL